MNIETLIFEKYLSLLIKWNRVYNLTSITDPDEIGEKHFSDSLIPEKFLPKGCSLLDIGSGAGFPGIPLKIARPDISVTLLEATQKKCNFCETAIRELGLKNIVTVCGRAEDKAIVEKIGKFDVVISRATFSLKDFIEIGEPYLKDEKSILIAMKGKDISDEVKIAQETISNLNLKLKIESAVLPETKAERNIIIASR